MVFGMNAQPVTRPSKGPRSRWAKSHHERAPRTAYLRLATVALLMTGSLALVPSAMANAATLTVPVWTSSSSLIGAANVTYTYSFTTASSNNLSTITMTVPLGTGGAPILGIVTATQPTYLVSSSLGGSISLAGNVLTYTFASSTSISSSTTITIPVNGLTNTSTVGSYASTITTNYTTYGSPSTAPEDTGTTAPVAIGPNSLNEPTWSTSNALTTSASVTYSFGAVTTDTATLTSVSATIPPGTSNGSLTVGPVTGVPSGGAVSLVSGLLQYTFPSTSVPSGTSISIQINGLINTSMVESYAPQIVTSTSTGADATGYAEMLSFTLSALTNTSWTTSNSTSGATNVTYAYHLTTTTSDNFTAVTMTVPPGTTGTPSLGTVTESNGGNPINPPSNPSVTRVGSELTYSFTSVYVNSSTTFTIPISGLDNTTSAESYTSQITTLGWSSTPPPSFPVDDAITAPVSISGGTVTVTFNSNGGTGTMSSESANTATALTTNTFTKSGYIFAGWNTVANGSGTQYADGASYPFASDATLYAQWGANSVAPPPPIATTAPPPSGVPVAALGTPTSTTTTSSAPTSVTVSVGASSVRVLVPADALPTGTTVSVYPVKDSTTLAASLPSDQSYVVASATSWLAPDGSTPTAMSPITTTVSDPSIDVGDTVYELTLTGPKAVGTATDVGTVTITFVNGSTFIVAHTNPVAQTTLTLTSITTTVGRTLTLAIRGGSGTGAVSYTVTNGTATGCVVSGNSLSATSAGTCLVTATKVADSNYSTVSSLATTVTFRVAQKAIKVTAAVWSGKSVVVDILGAGFYGKPRVTSDVRGTRVRVLRNNGARLTICVMATKSAPRGVHVFTIQFAHGEKVTVRYNQR